MVICLNQNEIGDLYLILISESLFYTVSSHGRHHTGLQKKSKCTIYHLYNSLTDHWRWLITVSIHCRLMYPVTHSLKIATMTYSLEFATLRYRQELATLTHTQLPTLTSPVSVCQSLSLPSVSADTPRPPGVASRLTTYTPTKQRPQSYQWESVACITT